MQRKVVARDKYLQRIYGITLEYYNKLLRKQKNSCAVCQKHKSLEKKSLSVDHNHQSGEIRGLICTYCNRYVIGRHCDPELLLKASEYLRQGTGLFVPAKKRKKRKKKKRS